MENLFELLITVILVGAGLWGIYWAVGKLKGKEPAFTLALVVFVAIVVAVIYCVAFKGWRMIQL